MPRLTSIGRPEKFDAVTLAEITASYAGLHLRDMTASARQQRIDNAQWILEQLVQEAEIT